MDKKKDKRRRAARYPVTWKTALVFDKTQGAPTMHTQTVDLSPGGAAVVSERGDITGSVVTVLLAQPGGNGAAPGRMLKVRANVVSSVELPNMPGYRLGLSFIRTQGDGLDDFEVLLQSAAPLVAEAMAAPAAQAPAEPAAPPPVQPAAQAPGGRLARLREMAQAKLTEPTRVDPQQEINQRIDAALQRAYKYLKEFTEQLDVVKPAYSKGYAIAGVPEFSGLAWDSGRAGFHAREISSTAKLWERVTLSIRISAHKKIGVSRETPANGRLRQLLSDSRIEFTERDARDERGHVRSTTFEIVCEIGASVLLEGKFDSGRILLRMRNIERFGSLEYEIEPEAITDEALEDFAGFILGETPNVGRLIQKR